MSSNALHNRPPVEAYQDAPPVPQPVPKLIDFREPVNSKPEGGSANGYELRDGASAQHIYWPNLDLPELDQNNTPVTPDTASTAPQETTDETTELGRFDKAANFITSRLAKRSPHYEQLAGVRKVLPHTMRNRGGDVALDPNAPKRLHNKVINYRQSAAKVDRHLGEIELRKKSVEVRSDALPHDSAGKWGSHVLPLYRLDYLKDLKEYPTALGFYIHPERGKIPIRLSRIDDYVHPLPTENYLSTDPRRATDSRQSAREILERRQEINAAYAAQQPYIQHKIEQWLRANPGNNVVPIAPIDATGGGLSNQQIEQMLEYQTRVVEERLGVDFDNPEAALERINNSPYYTPRQRKSEIKLYTEWHRLNLRSRQLKNKQKRMAQGTDRVGAGLIAKADRSRK